MDFKFWRALLLLVFGIGVAVALALMVLGAPVSDIMRFRGYGAIAAALIAIAIFAVILVREGPRGLRQALRQAMRPAPPGSVWRQADILSWIFIGVVLLFVAVTWIR